jgi:hypothetical protein
MRNITERIVQNANLSQQQKKKPKQRIQLQKMGMRPQKGLGFVQFFK